MVDPVYQTTSRTPSPAFAEVVTLGSTVPLVSNTLSLIKCCASQYVRLENRNQTFSVKVNDYVNGFL